MSSAHKPKSVQKYTMIDSIKGCWEIKEGTEYMHYPHFDSITSHLQAWSGSSLYCAQSTERDPYNLFSQEACEAAGWLLFNISQKGKSWDNSEIIHHYLVKEWLLEEGMDHY